MSVRYALDTKIDALNQIDRHDGDVALVSDVLEIPADTLRRWRRAEKDLRRSYGQRLQREGERLAVGLQMELLRRGKAILEHMDDETLAKAPLNQLATALTGLINTSLKLEEVIEQIDEAKEKVFRLEYYYDGQVQDAPPWASVREEDVSALQSRGLRETMGQNGTWQGDAAGERPIAGEQGLVAGADRHDGEPGLARLESERFAS